MGCRENIALVLNSLGINHYFNVIVSGSEIKKGKPHPEIYNRTLSLLNIKPKEAIVFEDTFNGVESAKQAGISVVGLSTSHTKAEFISWGVLDCIDNFFNCICNVSKN
jgi:beta-phosphoglucomutase-like phosphatase (HAD superfamily)